MSVDIVIQQSGVPVQIDAAAKIETRQPVSGSQRWVPEAEATPCVTGTLNGRATAVTTDESGNLVYLNPSALPTASARIRVGGTDRGFSGVSRLQTATPDGSDALWTLEGGYAEAESVSGKDSDGSDKSVRRGQGGNLVITELPAEIRVTTPPLKTEYADGETIDYSGMVVTAYRANGEVWTDADHPDGVIPEEELIRHRFYNRDDGYLAYKDSTTDYKIPFKNNSFMHYRLKLLNGWESHSFNIDTTGGLRACGYYFMGPINGAERYITCIVAAKNDAAVDEITHAYYKAYPAESAEETVKLEAVSYEINGIEYSFKYYLVGKRFYHMFLNQYLVEREGIIEIEAGVSIPLTNSWNIFVAWLMLYGDYYIDIGWKRPTDGRILTTYLYLSTK